MRICQWYQAEGEGDANDTKAIGEGSNKKNYWCMLVPRLTLVPNQRQKVVDPLVSLRGKKIVVCEKRRQYFI